jgi:hypothetical protein
MTVNAQAIEAAPVEVVRPINKHREFLDTQILKHAERLNAIANAYTHDVGGDEGLDLLIRDTIASTEIFVERLTELAVRWGVLTPEAS